MEAIEETAKVSRIAASVMRGFGEEEVTPSEALAICAVVIGCAVHMSGSPRNAIANVLVAMSRLATKIYDFNESKRHGTS